MLNRKKLIYLKLIKIPTYLDISIDCHSLELFSNFCKAQKYLPIINDNYVKIEMHNSNSWSSCKDMVHYDYKYCITVKKSYILKYEYFVRICSQNL